MRRLLAVAVPVIALLAAPAMAQTGSAAKGQSSARSSETMDTGARDIVASRDLVGKRVMYRHGGGVAGTIQDVTTGTDGRPAIALKVPNADQPLMMVPSDFERRGNSIILMHDREEVAQLVQFARQAATGFGSSTGGAGMGSGTGMNSGAMGTGPRTGVGQ
ncbi:hypothetical protein [Azospirillum thermophilum]|uniref:PRC-barrel domain-containing protein n=1 Tax=Azospirillum thermophilum TaxID=2202148 RepID=A0A2S2CTY3_9PROT|nr:hypothetical protein [Azospirillum thermophilum]AWK87830.1 hypothetical protein DEW08_18005 [Azospirillum thermophilum]